MLNYMRAELWKALRRRGFYLMLGVLVLGEWLLALTAWVPAGRSIALHQADLLVDLLPVGLFCALLMADLVFQDQYRHGTLKNELSFGMSRGRIYLGKTLSALLMGLLAAGIVLGCFCGLFLARSGAERTAALVRIAGYLSCALPLWTGGLGLAVALNFICRRGTTAASVYLLLLVLLPPLFGIGADNMLSGSVGFRILDGLRQVMLAEASGLPEALAWPALIPYMLRNWLIGMGWFWGSAAVGLALFQRQDIA